MSDLELTRRHKALVAVALNRFLEGGWSMVPTVSDAQDFIVTSGNLRYPIRCVAEIRGHFRSVESILDDIEKEIRFHRSNFNRIQITVLERNFLSISVDVLLQRGIFITTLQDLDNVIQLAEYGSIVPEDLTEPRKFLMQGDPGYAVFVSRVLVKQQRADEAIEWLNYAVSASSGFTSAHLELLTLYRDLGRLQHAEEIANFAQKMRPDDPRVMRLMVAFHKANGDHAQEEIWQAKLSGNNVVPRTFTDILERQKQNISFVRTNDIAEKHIASGIEPLHGRGTLVRWLRSLRLVR